MSSLENFNSDNPSMIPSIHLDNREIGKAVAQIKGESSSKGKRPWFARVPCYEFAIYLSLLRQQRLDITGSYITEIFYIHNLRVISKLWMFIQFCIFANIFVYYYEYLRNERFFIAINSHSSKKWRFSMLAGCAILKLLKCLIAIFMYVFAHYTLMQYNLCNLIFVRM